MVYIVCGVIYYIMKKNTHSTDKCLDELPFIFCGQSGDIEVYEDTDSELIEHVLSICKICNKTLRLVKREPVCPVCNKALTRNGYKSIYLNKTDEIHLQKYNHRHCKNSSCIASAESIKEKHHIYSRKVEKQSVLINLVNPESYAKKAEEIANQTGAFPERSTLFLYHKTHSETLFEYLEHLQYQEIDKLNIKPSGHYAYDEQYVYINKKLHMRLTIIDHHNKLIIADIIISEDDFNDKTIEKFLKESLQNYPIQSITTDGRQGYKTIIEAIGAIQHRCFFHIMQNLMTPLLRHTNKIERRIKTLNKKINKKETTIQEIKQQKKKYKGPIPHTDKKTRKQHNKIKKLEKEIKEHKKEKRTKNKELKEIDKDKKRIQIIWDSKTIKEATRKFNTIYNQKDHLNPIITKFLEKIKSNLDVIFNHIENKNIPATNNTIENYYRTTLPRFRKKIFRTIKGLQRAIREQKIRWTHRNVLKQNTPLNYNTTYN